jgi:Tfp pilus assembly protein FimT
MMLALGIMMILAGLGTARLVVSFEHAKVRRAAAILTADLQYAQGMAARQRRPVAVILNPDLRSYVIRDRASGVVYRQRFLGDDTDFDVQVLTSDQGSSLELFPTGVTRTTTTFTIGVKDYQRQVTLTQAGQIRLLPLETAEKGKK